MYYEWYIFYASAIAANEMNGTLQAFSAGKNKGATFILTLPNQELASLINQHA